MSRIVLMLALCLMFVSGCVTKTGSGALLGGALGALTGQAIGKDTKGTLIGAGVGAAIGGAIGNQEDAKDKKK